MIKTLVNIANALWGTPIIVLLFGASLYFTFRCHFVQLRHLGHQFKLLAKPTSGDVGITPFQAFCNTCAYRIGNSNISGVAIAVLFGGPGAVIWMIICSLLNAALSYAENSLGQVYKDDQDGIYEGGAYYYMEKGRGWKILPLIFALLTVIAVPILNPMPHANNVAGAFHNAIGIPRYVVGFTVAILLFLVISGGIKRIAKVATIVVPFMTIVYLGLTVVTLIVNAKNVPHMLYDMVSSAFGWNAVYGALLGNAVLWGVKRSVNSSGAGMAESLGSTSAAEVDHPGETGLVSSLTVFIDVAVCLCTGLLIMSTDCYNVLGLNGQLLHLGKGSEMMAQYAATNTADISWTQDALKVAVCLLFFSFTTNMNHYYQGEIAMRYLFRKASVRTRTIAVWVLRVAMPSVYVYAAIANSNDMWSMGDLACAILVWVNCIVLLIMGGDVVKIWRDYDTQRKAGIKVPIFDPDRLGIKNAEFWTKRNKSKFDEVNAKLKAYEKSKAA
jgi:AGCS family alanine or glycine:cation symporter